MRTWTLIIVFNSENQPDLVIEALTYYEMKVLSELVSSDYRVASTHAFMG